MKLKDAVVWPSRWSTPIGSQTENAPVEDVSAVVFGYEGARGTHRKTGSAFMADVANGNARHALRLSTIGTPHIPPMSGLWPEEGFCYDRRDCCGRNPGDNDFLF
jgi:hypothetical protein